MLKVLYTNKTSLICTLIRFYLGWQWLMAGWYKITGSFTGAGFLKDVVLKGASENSSTFHIWYAEFIDRLVLPHIAFFDFLIPWGEFLVGLGLIVGLFTNLALCAGAFMNLNFMFAGAMSINPLLFILALVLLIMGSSTSRFGLDYYVIPRIKELIHQ